MSKKEILTDSDKELLKSNTGLEFVLVNQYGLNDLNNLNQNLINSNSKTLINFDSLLTERINESIKKVNSSLELEKEELIKKIDSEFEIKSAELIKKTRVEENKLKKMKSQAELSLKESRKMNLVLDKTIDLLNSRMHELSELEEKLNPEDLKQLLSLLKNASVEFEKKIHSKEILRQLNNEMQLLAEKQADKFTWDVKEEINEEIKRRLSSTEKELNEKSMKLNELINRIDLDKIDSVEEELKVFEKQFLNTLKYNVLQFNKSKKELDDYLLNQKSDSKKEILAVQEKIHELEKFEENFAKEMGLALDKLKK
ncbi:MAG: hypothetical protein JW703_03115 [Candidatus Diapherotrites archaeon]|nr:hypothetical protein [Candidatus Diapherotrites archaeon]